MTHEPLGRHPKHFEALNMAQIGWPKISHLNGVDLNGKYTSLFDANQNRNSNAISFVFFFSIF